MSLRSYPGQAHDADAYGQAIANELHDPFNKAMVELFWHGTDDYQKFIKRDGLAAQQRLLAQIRNGKTYYFGMIEAAKKIDVAELRREVSKGVDATPGASDALELCGKMGFLKSQYDRFAIADERLTLALMQYLERHGDEPQSTQPTFNIHNKISVEPTPITLEANINVPATEVSVNLPPRHTITNIERNLAGEIVRADQIETSI